MCEGLRLPLYGVALAFGGQVPVGVPLGSGADGLTLDCQRLGHFTQFQIFLKDGNLNFRTVDFSFIIYARCVYGVLFLRV